jgi:hypothetical protein
MKSPCNPTRISGGDKAVKGKIDGAAWAKVGEGVCHPDAQFFGARMRLRMADWILGAEVGMVRKM